MSNKTIFEKEKLSLWLKDDILNEFPSVKSDVSTQICIIGAGITGITTAYILSQLGTPVVLIDSGIPINLTTGNTTAKFTFQHGIIYSKIIEKYGLDQALLYYESQVEAMQYVKKLIVDYNIQCDFNNTYSMIYGETKKEFDEIKEEYEAYKKLNIPCELVYDLPYGISGIGGLKVNNQFNLNPVKYLGFLLDKLMENGVQIYQNTNAVDIEENDNGNIIITEDGYKISTKKIIITTGYPFFDGGGLYFTRLAPYRSYLVAFPSDIQDSAMLISNSQSPYSIRFTNTDGIKYVLIGGKGHKVGQEESAMDSYNQLIDFGIKHFGVINPSYRWSAQDYESLDKIPYVGNITSKHEDILVATGFRKWGMTNGTSAAILLSNLIKEEDSKFKELFNPSRSEMLKSTGKFMKENLNVAKELIKGKILPDEIKLEDIKNDEGGIIKHNGKRVGAYRDNNGTLFLVDSTCTHLGCELEYNNGERSFDCPCHGSRFTYEGKVIEGPAVLDLKKIDE
jgi:glycine/D-amino acid oxidase-like deaminating enzyme/nitrite reductase/ring-hydroxylating ferredoxin subunit